MYWTTVLPVEGGQYIRCNLAKVRACVRARARARPATRLVRNSSRNAQLCSTRITHERNNRMPDHEFERLPYALP